MPTKHGDKNPISIAFGGEVNSGMRRGDLGDLTAFIAVGDNLSFRAAAARLGVTPSALSHTMRQLEERLGVRVLHRTTRSVSLIDAGRRLIERLRPAIDQIASAIDDLSGEQQRPYGSLPIHATHMAAAAVIAGSSSAKMSSGANSSGYERQRKRFGAKP